MKLLIKAVGAGGLLLLACLSIAAAQEKEIYRGTVSPNSTQHAFIRKSKADKTLLVVNALALGGAAFALVTWIVDDLSVLPETKGEVGLEDSQPESDPTLVLPSAIQIPEVPEQTIQTQPQEGAAVVAQENLPEPPQIPEELFSELQKSTTPQTQDQQVVQAPLSEDELINAIGNPRI